MKRSLLLCVSLCIVAVVTSTMLLTSCDSRAKIAFDKGSHNDDDDDDPDYESTDVEFSVEVGATRQNSIDLYINIDNYYDDQLYKKMSLKKCGIIYRSAYESSSSEKRTESSVNGGYGRITLSNLNQGTSYYITPFAIDDNRPNHTYRGETITVRTKGY